MIKYFIIASSFLCFAAPGRTQVFDSLNINVGLESRFSSKDYQPFWLVSNRYGVAADRKNDLSPFIRISGKNVLAEHEYLNDYGFYDYNDLDFSYGISVYNNNHFRSTLLEEAYGMLEYKKLALSAGRMEQTTGDIDPELSTGSLGVSGNALPVPKIELSIVDYIPVPFTGGWLQFRGSFAHGWLGHDRYIRNSYYHEKTFFLRVGPHRLKFYAGIEHFAEWGGYRSDEQTDRSWKGFFDVVFAREGSNTDGGTHAGDQRGVLDGGVYWENDRLAIHGYLQKPFEGKRDIGFGSKNVLAGIIVSMKNRYLGLQKILVEILSTKGINEHIESSKRESYYNSNIYKTGWEYQDHIIGTPLFINRIRANKYFPEITSFDWNLPAASIPGNANIIDNRVFAVHTGISYSISAALDGKTLLTYSENYGSAASSTLFMPSKNEFYGLQQISYDIPKKHLTITAAIGFDCGQLSKTAVAGGFLKIEWDIRRSTGDNNLLR